MPLNRRLSKKQKRALFKYVVCELLLFEGNYICWGFECQQQGDREVKVLFVEYDASKYLAQVAELFTYEQ